MSEKWPPRSPNLLYIISKISREREINQMNCVEWLAFLDVSVIFFIITLFWRICKFSYLSFFGVI